MIDSRLESHVSHISRESADGKEAKQALNWIKELEGERLSRDGHQFLHLQRDVKLCCSHCNAFEQGCMRL